MTEWKYIDGYGERYKIYADGRVEQLSGGEYKPKAQYDKGDGYMTVNLYKAGERHRAHLVHRLVATHFMPTEDNSLVVNHKDGDKKNNRLDNLEWVTRKENAAHAVKHGLHTSNALLTDKQVIEIRYAFDNGYRNIGQLAEDYGVSRKIVKSVVERTTYKERENMSFYQVTYYVKEKLLKTTVLAKTVKDARGMIKHMTPLAKIKGVEKRGRCTMRDKLLILCATCSILTLIAMFNVHQQVSEKDQAPTYYTQAYMLSDRKRQEVIDADGAMVQVDVLKYGDGAKPYYKVVHCRTVEKADGEEVVECYIDEVQR